MTRRLPIAGAVLVAVLGFGNPALAQVAEPCPACSPPTPSHGRVDPRFDAYRRILARFGPESPYFGPRGLGDARTDGAGAMLRFRRPLTEAEIEALADAGVEFLERGGERVVVGTVYGAFVRWEALDALRAHPLLVFAEAAWHPRVETPLEVTGREIGSAQHLQLGDEGRDGTGTVVGDIDSGIDVLHPHFFFADGGAFDWIDVDGDGALTPGADAIDYNDDGEADVNETVRVLDGGWVDARGQTHNADDMLDVRFDWLYADSNGDAERNVGAAAGFTELDPGYGEPVFVADDADRDGTLDIEEKVLLLGTSKIRRFVTSGHTWERGVDLIHAADVEFLDQAMHGTGVSSILVGGQPRAHDRVGIAPGAELVMYSSHMDAPGNGFDDTAQLADLRDAVSGELDVVIHEWTNPYTAPHDGSGNFEAAMDDARRRGVVQVNPMGNLNLAEKHRVVRTRAGEEVDLTFVVDEGFPRGGARLPYSSVYGSIFWRGDQLPTLDLVSPDGTTVALPLDGSAESIGPDWLQATHTLTDRGTHQVVLFVWNEAQDTSIQRGDWTIRITGTTADDRFVGRIADYYSSWGVGVRWARPTADVGTLVYPSTADAAFGVAAYGGRHANPREQTEPGELRAFSGRGPRMDGAPAVDIAAPDDPYVALVGSPAWLDSGYDRGWFTIFGGTSGAGPHVAGAVALLRSDDATLTADAIEDRIVQSARVDQFTPPRAELPDSNWGAGKLDVFAALNGRAVRQTDESPVVELSVEEVDDSGMMRLDASESSDPDGDVLRFRWDFDYDGVWDTELTDDPVARHTFDVGESRVRLDVHDSEGGVRGLVRRIEIEDDPSDDVGTSTDAGFVPRPDVSIERPDPRPRDPVCGCGSAGEGGTWSFLFLLVWLGRPRRRR